METLQTINFDQQPVNLEHYHATSMAELQALLRKRLKAIQTKEISGSLRKIGREINVSHTYLAKFRDGKAICMNIMNNLANHFGYRYFIENYKSSADNTNHPLS
jgi:hypothetical protein